VGVAAGVVDEDVDAGVAAEDMLDGGVDSGVVGDVEAQELGGATSSGDVVGDLGAPGVDVEQPDPGALPRPEPCRGLADAVGRAGHHGDETLPLPSRRPCRHAA
jgi:hypothetical protein